MNFQIMQTRYPSTSNTLVHILQKRAMEYPNQTAYFCISDVQQEGKKITYGELDRKAREIAATLQSFTSPQEKALLIFPPGLDFITALFGCLYAGVIAVPVCPPNFTCLDRDLPYLKNIIADAQANVILTDNALFSLSGNLFLFTSDYGSVQWLTTDKIGLASEYDFHPISPKEEYIAILEYQSGTSRKPWGVSLTYQQINSNLSACSSIFHYQEGAINLSWLPPYHDIGLVEGILQSVYSGSKTLLLPTSLIQDDPLLWIRLISKYQVNISGGPDFAYDRCSSLMLKMPDTNLRLDNWTTAYTGSKRLYSDTFNQFYKAFKEFGFKKESFIPYYGFNIPSMFVSGGKLLRNNGFNKLSTIVSDQYHCISRNHPGDGDIVGYKLDQCSYPLSIIDPYTRKLLGASEFGEVVVFAPNTEDKTNEILDTIGQVEQTLIPGSDKKTFIQTGDLGFIEQDHLFILGNSDDCFQIENRWYFRHAIEIMVTNSVLEQRAGKCVLLFINAQDENELVLLFEVDIELWSGQPERISIQKQQLSFKIRQVVKDQFNLTLKCLLLLPPNSIPAIPCCLRKHDLLKEYYLSGYFSQKVI